MKKYLFSITVTVLTVLGTLAQDKIEVMRYEYEVTFKPSVKSDEMFTESVFLDVWDTSSRFYSKGYATRVESLANPKNKGLIGKSVSMPDELTDFEAVVVRDNNKLFYVQQVTGTMLKVESLINQVKWTLEEEIEQYEGMKVQKAVGELSGRTWTVWFTTEVPVIEGPYKFKNLPGFVVKAKDDKGDYTFEFRKSEKAQVPVHFYEYEKASLSKESELVKIRNVRANMTSKQSLAAQRIVIVEEDTIENQQKMNQKIGDNTNYIEHLKK
ncbi:GLPGLI family protein [Myroides sp. M-43]|uniref:GLPGLI family protein n=1 Tax=Myroides oncorhynchi TaxID=2893756 RepID=UPI001E636AC6|nr:GLPGLI family protein [Myroides oncorhynchi]MCC9043059.1 GLPGLI family protein [Myroides oncorhynchi]